MRVLMVNYEFPPIGGGGATATLFLAKALLKQGHEVCVLTGGIGWQCQRSVEEGVEVVRIPTLRKLKDRANILEMSSFALAGILWLPAVVRRFKPHRAIVMFTIPCGHIGLALKKIWGVPYVISLAGGDVPGQTTQVNFYHQLLGPLRRAILANANAVVANSDGLANLSRETDPVEVEVIPNGVDCLYFKPGQKTTTEQEPFRFLFVGRLSSEKRLSRLLDELAVLRRSWVEPFVLHVVGDGPEASKLREQSAKLELKNIVFWHGWIDRQSLRDIYQNSDCLVNNSLYEGMSNAIQEAMASGLAVIASAVRGNTDTVVHGESGLLFDPDQPNGLQQAMRQVMADRDAARSLGLRARDFAQTRFSWDSAAERYMALFDSHTKPENHHAV